MASRCVFAGIHARRSPRGLRPPATIRRPTAEDGHRADGDRTLTRRLPGGYAPAPTTTRGEARGPVRPRPRPRAPAPPAGGLPHPCGSCRPPTGGILPRSGRCPGRHPCRPGGQPPKSPPAGSPPGGGRQCTQFGPVSVSAPPGRQYTRIRAASCQRKPAGIHAGRPHKKTDARTRSAWPASVAVSVQGLRPRTPEDPLAAGGRKPFHQCNATPRPIQEPEGHNADDGIILDHRAPRIARNGRPVRNQVPAEPLIRKLDRPPTGGRSKSAGDDFRRARTPRSRKRQQIDVRMPFPPDEHAVRTQTESTAGTVSRGHRPTSNADTAANAPSGRNPAARTSPDGITVRTGNQKTEHRGENHEARHVTPVETGPVWPRALIQRPV
jgi:hypothetical protein